MKIALLTGAMAGQEFEVAAEIAVGREGTDIEIEDPAISRRHAVFRRTDGGLEVEDLGSTNGTFVNGDRITGTRALEPGDFVALGGTTIEVRGDWRSAETQAIAVAPEAPQEDEVEEYVPTAPFSAPTADDPQSNTRRLLVIAGAVGLILALGIWFFARGGSDAFAQEADAVCEKAEADNNDDKITGDDLATLKPAARRLLNVRTNIRQKLAAMKPEKDAAPAFGTFLERYGTTNNRLRQLSKLSGKAKKTQVRLVVSRVRSSALSESRAAREMGLEVCGGLPV